MIGGLIRAWSAQLSIVAGIVIIVMGLHFLGLTRIGLLMREGRLPMPKPVGLWGAYAMGLAFAFGWTPCIGPILAAILSIAAAEATVTKGAGLLAVYSAGLGIPFLLAAFMIEQFSSLFARMKRHLASVEQAMGVLMVITGIGFLTGAVIQHQHLAAGDFPRIAKFSAKAAVTSGPAAAKLLPGPDCRHRSRGAFARTGFKEAAGRGLTYNQILEGGSHEFHRQSSDPVAGANRVVFFLGRTADHAADRRLHLHAGRLGQAHTTWRRSPRISSAGASRSRKSSPPSCPASNASAAPC